MVEEVWGQQVERLIEAVGRPTVFKVADDVNGIPGRTLTVELKDQPAQRKESPPTEHVFHEVGGFARYLAKYGSTDLVVLADTLHMRVAAILDEGADCGREIIQLCPPVHPRLQPWCQHLGQSMSVETFVLFLREHRRTIIEPPARDVIMALSQIQAKTEVKVHKGQGKRCLNGVVVKTEIQGVVKDEVVELPETLVISVPLFLGRDPVRIEIDVALDADREGNVIVRMTTGDLTVARYEEFCRIVADLEQALDMKEITFAMGECRYGVWEYRRA